MILLSSPASPFGRKIKIAASILGLSDQITMKPTSTQEPDAYFHQVNPLGKIPALVLDDETVLYDSRVIMEYLDSISTGPNIFVKDGIERYKDLTLNALADGMMDASILRVYEGRYRPEEMQVESWLKMQRGKVNRSLDVLEANPPSLAGDITVGRITLACALGYLDFRFEARWRKRYPNLVAWLDAFAAKVPAYDKTKPPAG